MNKYMNETETIIASEMTDYSIRYLYKYLKML